jgi:hypothetical protein
MNDENGKIVEESLDIDNENNTNDQQLITEIPAVDVAGTSKIKVTNEEPLKKESSSSDISKVKIRDILKQRFKKMNPGLKKAIPLILVGIICFAAGIGADRAFIGRRLSNNLRNRPVINQPMPNNRFNGSQGNMKNNQNMPYRFNNRTK